MDNQSPAEAGPVLSLASSPGRDPPVIESINMKKGGPRTTLYELCKKVQWPLPTLKTTEEKSRTPVEFVEGAEKRKGFNSFVSKIILNIPRFGVIECTGDPRADKKSSFDSAALVLLNELCEKGQLIISDPK